MGNNVLKGSPEFEEAKQSGEPALFFVDAANKVRSPAPKASPDARDLRSPH